MRIYISKKIEIKNIFDIKLIKGERVFLQILLQIFSIYKVFAKIYDLKSFV